MDFSEQLGGISDKSKKYKANQSIHTNIHQQPFRFSPCFAFLLSFLFAFLGEDIKACLNWAGTQYIRFYIWTIEIENPKNYEIIRTTAMTRIRYDCATAFFLDGFRMQ